ADLVAWQFRIAAGERLSADELSVPAGHAIEFRINAEDPGRGFLPAAGVVTRLELPGGPGVRVDSGVTAGSSVSSRFDSLLAKVVVRGATRREALARARRALAEFVIEGIPTVLPASRAVLEHPDFSGTDGFRVHTEWLETELLPGFSPEAAARPAAAGTLRRLPLEIDGRLHTVGLPAGLLSNTGAQPPEQAGSAAPPEGEEAVQAPATGQLLRWTVADGAAVRAGEPVAVLEAMKLEMQLTAPRAGTIRLLAEAGSSQEAGAVVARIEN
ncbi:MAG TPA: biotin/lipoyl-containing protein, partial [Deinococcales bacterium]|nr:biotin/lipoyl-containing protein [Deinococcales bacterium]